MLKKVGFFVLILLFTSSCSFEKERSLHHEMRVAVVKGDFNKAIDNVKSDDFYDEKSDLLKYLELGNIYYLKGDYYQALSYFDKGLTLSRDLYTKSIKAKIMANMINDNYDLYYGKNYEISMLRFYSAMCHYHLYEQGFYEEYETSDNVKIDKRLLSDDERRVHLNSARAVVSEWNSFLKTLKEENLGDAVFKDDLLGKVFSAFIHEVYGGYEDEQTALVLYQNARDVLFKNYGIYPSFNKKYKEFYDNYSKFNDLGVEKIRLEYFSPTASYVVVEKFLNDNISRLKSKKKDNVRLIVKDALVSEKIADKIEIDIPVAPLLLAAENDRDVLAFLPMLIGGGKISFEFPKVLEPLHVNPYKIEILNNLNKKVYTSDLPVINPLSDIAYLAYLNDEVATKAKIVSRVISKHVAAIASAYLIYKNGEKSTLALFSAMLAYSASKAAINSSEQADIRYWGALAGNVFATSFNLGAGDYCLNIYNGEGKKAYEQKFTVGKSSILLDVNLLD